jgi:hypothetical protein
MRAVDAWGRWIAQCGGRGNGDGGRPYVVYTCNKKSLVTQLSNIFRKLEKCIHEDSYLHHRDDVLLALHQILHHLLVMLQPFLILLIPALAGRLMRKGRKNVVVGLNSHGPPPCPPKACLQ